MLKLLSREKVVGSVDFLGNPIGLVSTLGTGVKDFFFTPAQMLLEDESGLRIDNLRTGMTKVRNITLIEYTTHLLYSVMF